MNTEAARSAATIQEPTRSNRENRENRGLPPALPPGQQRSPPRVGNHPHGRRHRAVFDSVALPQGGNSRLMRGPFFHVTQRLWPCARRTEIRVQILPASSCLDNEHRLLECRVHRESKGELGADLCAVLRGILPRAVTRGKLAEALAMIVAAAGQIRNPRCSAGPRQARRACRPSSGSSARDAICQSLPSHGHAAGAASAPSAGPPG